MLWYHSIRIFLINAYIFFFNTEIIAYLEQYQNNFWVVIALYHYLHTIVFSQFSCLGDSSTLLLVSGAIIVGAHL